MCISKEFFLVKKSLKLKMLGHYYNALKTLGKTLQIMIFPLIFKKGENLNYSSSIFKRLV